MGRAGREEVVLVIARRGCQTSVIIISLLFICLLSYLSLFLFSHWLASQEYMHLILATFCNMALPLRL